MAPWGLKAFYRVQVVSSGVPWGKGAKGVQEGLKGLCSGDQEDM